MIHTNRSTEGMRRAMLGSLLLRGGRLGPRLLQQLARASTSKYAPATGAFVAPSRTERDVIIIGGGHNGLVAAAYLAKAGLDVLVLERRHLLGACGREEKRRLTLHWTTAPLKRFPNLALHFQQAAPR